MHAVDDSVSPLFKYTPDFLSSIYLLSTSLASSNTISFTTQNAERTRLIYDIFGEQSLNMCAEFTIPLNQSDSIQQNTEESKNECDIVEGVLIDLTKRMCIMVHNTEHPIIDDRPEASVSLLEQHYCITKNTWINGYFSKNANYTNTIIKHQLSQYLLANKLVTDGVVQQEQQPLPPPPTRNTDADGGRRWCFMHSRMTDHVSQGSEPCGCPFDEENTGATSCAVFAWRSIMDASTNAGCMGKDSSAKRDQKGAEPYIVGDSHKLTYASSLALLTTYSRHLDPSRALSFLAFCFQNEPISARIVSSANNTCENTGTTVESSQGDERLYYFKLDQSYSKTVFTMKCAKNTLMPVVSPSLYCSIMRREYFSVNKPTGDDWRGCSAYISTLPPAAQQFMRSALLHNSVVQSCANNDGSIKKESCSTGFDDDGDVDEIKLDGDWFSVTALGNSSSLLAIRKDVFLAMKSTWMCHNHTNLPMYDQLLKHWNMKSQYAMVNNTRRFNVLRKLLAWMDACAGIKHMHFMLSPDHVDFTTVYDLLFPILALWNDGAGGFKNAVIYSHNEPTKPSMLKAVVSFLLITKKHAVDKKVVVDLHNWLNGLSDSPCSDYHTRCKNANAAMPHLSHVLSTLRRSKTPLDKERALKNSMENVSIDILKRTSPSGCRDARSNNIANVKEVGVELRKRVPVAGAFMETIVASDVDGYLNNLLNIGLYGATSDKSLKRSRALLNGFDSVEVDFSFLKPNYQTKTDDAIDVVKEQVRLMDVWMHDNRSKTSETVSHSFYETFGESELSKQYFHRRMFELSRNGALLSKLNSYTHLMDNTGCLFEYERSQVDKPRSNKRRVQLKWIDNAVRGVTKNRSVSNRRSRPIIGKTTGMQRLTRECIIRICAFLNTIKKDIYATTVPVTPDPSSQHPRKRTKKSSGVHIADATMDEGIDASPNTGVVPDCSEPVEEHSASINTENDCCEELLGLGAYFATKELYKACACEDIPEELRKRLFINIFLVDKRKSADLRKVNNKAKYHLVACHDGDGEDDITPDILTSSTASNTRSSWDLGAAPTSRETYQNMNVPVVFDPPYLKNSGAGYVEYLERFARTKTDSMRQYVDKTIKRNVLRPDASWLNGPVGWERTEDQQGPNENQTEEWLWRDDVLFGDESMKLEAMALMSERSSTDCVMETQRQLFAFVEFMYNVGKGRRDADKLAAIDATLLVHTPLAYMYRKSLTNTNIISLDRDDVVKSVANSHFTTGALVPTEVDEDNCRKTHRRRGRREACTLKDYIIRMHKNTAEMDKSKSTLHWRRKAEVNKTYDDALLMVFYGKSACHKWKMLNDMYVKRNIIGERFTKYQHPNNANTSDLLLLEHGFLIMEEYMVDNTLGTIKNPKYHGSERQRCARFIKHLKTKLKTGSTRPPRLPTLNGEQSTTGDVAIIQSPVASDEELYGVDLGIEGFEKLKLIIESLEKSGQAYQLYPLELDGESMDDSFDCEKNILYITRYR